MPEKEGNGAWWKPAITIFGEVSSWVIVPIILSLVIGKFLDSYFGTRPWIFLGLTAAAFVVSIFGIVKVVRKYIQKIQQNDNGRSENSSK